MHVVDVARPDLCRICESLSFDTYIAWSREICGPRDYLGEHKKRKRKKEKEMEAKCEETGGEIHGSVYGGSVRDGQFMG